MARWDGFFRDCKQSNEEHERFVRQNKMIALAEEKSVVSRTDRGTAITKKTCLNCDSRRDCKRFKRASPVSGVASVGGYDDDMYKPCDDWKERKLQVNPQKIKGLMREFRRNT